MEHLLTKEKLNIEEIKNIVNSLTREQFFDILNLPIKNIKLRKNLIKKVLEKQYLINPYKINKNLFNGFKPQEVTNILLKAIDNYLQNNLCYTFYPMLKNSFTYYYKNQEPKYFIEILEKLNKLPSFTKKIDLTVFIEKYFENLNIDIKTDSLLNILEEINKYKMQTNKKIFITNIFSIQINLNDFEKIINKIQQVYSIPKEDAIKFFLLNTKNKETIYQILNKYNVKLNKYDLLDFLVNRKNLFNFNEKKDILKICFKKTLDKYSSLSDIVDLFIFLNPKNDKEYIETINIIKNISKKEKEKIIKYTIDDYTKNTIHPSIFVEKHLFQAIKKDENKFKTDYLHALKNYCKNKNIPFEAIEGFINELLKLNLKNEDIINFLNETINKTIKENDKNNLKTKTDKIITNLNSRRKI